MDDAPEISPTDIAEKAAHDLEEAEARLRAELAKVDATAVFASYSFSQLVSMQKETPGKQARPAPAAVELAAWLLYPEFGGSKSREDDRIQAAITALEKYETAFSFTEMFAILPVHEPDDELAIHLRLHSGMVRGSAYPIQVVRRINGVMGPLESELSSRVGIGPCRACELVNALTAQLEDNVNGMRDAFCQFSARGDALAAKGDALTEKEHAQLAGIGLELRRIVDGQKGDWVPSRAQVTARLGGTSETEWRALAATIGLTPSNRAALTKVVDVQDRPVFFLDSEHLFSLSGVACLDAVFAFFDDLARNDASLRDRYGRCVSGWMELDIERQMLRLFPAASVVRNACFSDPDHPGGETEADVVIVWGPFLIVAEAKGKRIGREAMRGNRAQLTRTIKNNIEDAFIQSRRVVRVLERDDKIQFKEKATDRLVKVELDHLQRVMAISVTLQNLSGIPTQLAITQRLGLFKRNAYPWSVCIDDLDVITRFAGSPDVFLHYIERRTAHQKCQILLHGDELDIFGQYLENLLHPSLYEKRKEITEHAGHNSIAFSGGDETFEPFYTAEWYGKPPLSPIVELKVPPEIRSILGELRNRSEDGARWIAFALLGLSHPALNRLAQAVKTMRTTPAAGQRILRITMREEDLVINVLAHRGLTESNFVKNATKRTRLEHYRARARATFTLGIDQRDVSKPFEVAQWVEGPWEHNPVIEQLLAEDSKQPRAVRLPHNLKKPGRNDPCSCGSGKKFKKCCIGHMTFRRAN